MSIASVEQLVGLPGAGMAPALPARQELPGLRKAAIFLAQLTKEEAGALLSKFKPREVESLEKETKPPRRFSDASLLGAMEAAGKDLDDGRASRKAAARSA